MSLAMANVEIREALTEAEKRHQADVRERELWRLEYELEELHLAGYTTIPWATFDLGDRLERCDLTPWERWHVSHCRTIKALIALILDDLLEQPLEIWNSLMVPPFHYRAEDFIPVRETTPFGKRGNPGPRPQPRKVAFENDVDCSEPGCDLKAVRKGLCNRHYQQHWRALGAVKVVE